MTEEMQLTFSQTVELLKAVSGTSAEEAVRQHAVRLASPTPPSRTESAVLTDETLAAIHKAVVLPRDTLATNAHVGHIRKAIIKEMEGLEDRIKAHVEHHVGTVLLHAFGRDMRSAETPTRPEDMTMQQLIDAGYEVQIKKKE